ncbi:MAG: polymerase, sigma-24 subunit, subfamily [Bryobacterales bacterium]|nr:polymerase, sigma-24 subunit, subfamily [Bryobacterales bacterium]
MVSDETLLRLHERIVSFAASRISRDSAEDLGQEVLLLLRDKYPHVDAPAELLPLALRIVRLKIAGLRPNGEPDPEALARLHRAIEQTGERCRRIIRSKLEGKTFAKIQALLGVGSINTVYIWDYRCRTHLLEVMGGSREEKR